MKEELSSYMRKIAEGDKKSFRFIANSLGYKMHSTSIKLLGPSHFDDADDVVQISLIKLWQSAPRWVNKGSVEGYIYKIVFQLVWIILEDTRVLMNIKIIIQILILQITNTRIMN